MMNQEFKAQGTKHQVWPNFVIYCRELGGLRVESFRACVRSFCSAGAITIVYQMKIHTGENWE